MLIQASITSTVDSEIDIPVPSFFVSKDRDNYIALIDEETAVEISMYKGYTTITNSSTRHYKSNLVRAYQKMDTCEESEFMQAFEKAIESVSLTPKLVTCKS